MTKSTVVFVTLALVGCASEPPPWKVLEERVVHLGTAGQPEWLEFAQDPPQGRDLLLPFVAEAADAERSLFLLQNNVKYGWTLELNGKRLGQLPQYEIPIVSAFAVPAGTLKTGDNVLKLVPPRENEDILVGKIRLDSRPLAQVLGESTLEISVVESLTGGGIPCRITIVDERLDALPPLVALPGQRLAVRPGVIYTTDGRARVTLPAGRYRVHAGRGFEYSVETRRVRLDPGETEKVELRIRHEVPTPYLYACDTHIHTLTFSGHGDSTDNERAITLAGEGIELPIATEHNQLNGYAAAAARMGVLSRFTPVLGSEITTPAGHFNVFPVDPGSPVADWKVTDWPKLLASIRAMPGVRVAILNHPRNNHSNFIPFADANFNRVTGDNRRGPDFTFDAMELLNSSALRSDDLEVFRDWLTLLNHGYRITGIGSSDCHEVNRFIVGQGRTYIWGKDADPARIDVSEACESLLQGRALVSLGLLTQIKVNGRSGPGDLATAVAGQVDVEVKVLGPSWTRVDRVELYANGLRIRDEWIEDGGTGGEKAKFRWKISLPKNDVHLVAIASGPGVRELYWPLSRPYQPNTPLWNPRGIGIANPVWVDADGDGVYTAPRALAAKVIALHEKDEAAILAELDHFDEAVATQAAGLLQARGTDLKSPSLTRALQGAGDAVRRGFAAVAASSPEK